jgi:drug/metabolite transporter (DMT)-like permease
VKPTHQSTSFLVLFVGVAAASTAAIFIRFAQGLGVKSIDIAAYRLLFSVVILLPVILWRHRSSYQSVLPSTIKWSVVGGVFLSLHFALWISSLEYTSISSSVVLVTTTPVWLGLFSILFQKEKLTRPFLAGLSLCILGGAIIAVSEDCSLSSQGLLCGNSESAATSPLLGNLMALSGAWMAAGYFLVGKKVRKTLPTTPYIFLVYGVAAICLILFSFVAGGNMLALPPSSIFWLVCLAIFPQLIGHTSFNWALNHFSATYVSIALLAEPIGSTLLGIIIFKEIPSIIKIGGGLLILIGILIVSLGQTPSKVQEPIGDSYLP